MSDETTSQTEQITGLRGRRLAATFIDLLILGPTALLIMLVSKLNVLFIFSQSQRCLHDYLAVSLVVRAA